MGTKCFVALVIVAVSTGACATSRMGEAEVSLVNGQVCFAPAATELKRSGALDVVGVWVSDLSRQPMVEVWAAAREGNARPTVLKRGDCLTYGATPENWTRTQASPLARETVYSVSLMSDLKDPADSTRAFQAKFCLSAQASGGAVKLIQLRPGTTGWRQEICQDR
jgi:hypothetical protein